MQRHESFPKLYGAPAQFRELPHPGQPERPASADDLPLEFDRSGEDQKLADQLVPRPYRYGARPAQPVEEDDMGEIQPANVTLRGLAHKFLAERATRPIPEFKKPRPRGRGRRSAS